MGNKKLVIDPKAAIPGQKYQKDKPWSCRYCYWWGKGGCKEKQCHYLASEIKKENCPASRDAVKAVPMESICRASVTVLQLYIGK